MQAFVGIAEALRSMARTHGDTAATVVPRGARAGLAAATEMRYRIATFAELDARSEAIAAGLAELGVVPGTKVATMVPPTEDFFALIFALLKAGAVPVLVDPGIGVPALKACLGEAAPAAFIGVPKAHLARAVLGWCPGAALAVRVGGGALGALIPRSGASLAVVEARGRARVASGEHRAVVVGADDLAAVLFTSGSTGTPKGVEYVHRNLAAQVDLIRAAYDIRPGTVNVATFPPFALFGPALGMTTIVPRMDPTKPAKVDPREVRDAVVRFGAMMMFGSPALLDTVSRWGERTGETLPTMATVISAGAPMTPRVLRRLLAMLPVGAEIYTPYGATECMPVTNVRSSEILALTQTRAGICVGFPASAVDVGVIRITDEPIAALGAGDFVRPGDVGEVVVRGPNVTRAYHRRDEATRLAKTTWDGALAHRMGDLGWFDADGRLWFAGRKGHRVETAAGTLFSVPVEEVFNRHPSVYRSALVGVGPAGARMPVLWVELEPGVRATPRLAESILRAADDDAENTGAARVHTVLFHRGFPVDIRHNSKIRREDLAVEATRRLGAGVTP